MDEARRQILTLVARGEMEPSEAADRLAELEGTSPTAGPSGTDPGQPGVGAMGDPTGPNAGDTSFAGPGEAGSSAGGPSYGSSYESYEPGPAGPGISRVRIDARVRSVIVTGDPDVATAVADGPHLVDWDGDTLVITEDHAHPDGLQFDWQDRPIRFRGRDMLRARTLRVRMHPSLALDAAVSAGALTVRGVHAPISAAVSAGSARIDEFDGPLALTVSAGSVTARGRLADGQSRIECDAGSVNLGLFPGSSVTIRARSDLGRVSLPGTEPGDNRGWFLGGVQEATVGGGRADLDIRVNMGAVSVSSL
jgi:hypothetical protein